MFEKKNRTTAGADERTPSKAEYFSWINNTNEGSTEKQTLINLEYFEYLKKEYNMQLDVYAWDAGNLDGADSTYETLDSPKLRAQYPGGYGPSVEKARALGCRMGVWGGIDGYGDTEESAKKRLELLVSLARDYNFALFKFDTVCGSLKDEHEKYFIEMMKECRRHVPDFILLNHRVPLSKEAERYATTFLWEGVETYVDVHISNSICAPHHRAYIMDRGLPPNMTRLTEDHGVCLSSHLDYFEDDLIIQAFLRNLLIAPQIYGNPWLLADYEQPRLARIFNLHRRYRDILVDGFHITDELNYPEGTVVRGSESKRFLTGAVMDWYERRINISLDSSIGLAHCDKVRVCFHHPFEEFIGEFSYGEKVTVKLSAFRAFLIEICDAKDADVMLEGCRYEVLHEDEKGRADKVRLFSSNGNIQYTDGRAFETAEKFDNTPRAPKLLCEISPEAFSEIPEDAERQLECALFVQDHDSLELQSLKRSGESSVPQVNAAREAFFSQETYRARGCENSAAFDGKKDTFFDGISRLFFLEDGFRIDGGCLRVDFGETFDADEVYIEFFDPDITEKGYHATVATQTVPAICDYSADMNTWIKAPVNKEETLYEEEQKVIISNLHSFKTVKGRRRFAAYSVNGAIRYFRMPCPVDRIYKIALFKDGNEVTLNAPRANNLMPYGRKVSFCKETAVRISKDDLREGCYLSVCLEGVHGVEGAYAVLEVDGEYTGAPDRAPGYSTNAWECYAARSYSQDHHYTYYFPISEDMCDKNITVRLLGIDEELKNWGVRVFLCDKNLQDGGKVCKLTL